LFRKNQRFAKRNIFFYRLFAVLAAALTLLVLSDAYTAPVFKAYAEAQANIIASGAVNSAIIDFMAENAVAYGDLVSIEKDGEGKVAALKTDSLEANRIKADIAMKITDYISKTDRRQIAIPIGTLSGVDYLAGRGPRVKFYLSVSCTASANLADKFESAGINQTRHQLILETATIVYALTPGRVNSTTVSTNIIIAETIIFGAVPLVGVRG